MGKAPQPSHDASGGRAATVAAGASTLPAHVPCRRSGSGCVITSSPSRSSATPEPTAATVPAADVPSAIGGGPPICQLPILTRSSQLPMPAATTSMRTSPAAGGAGSSTSKISTGSPSAVIPAARICLAHVTPVRHAPARFGTSREECDQTTADPPGPAFGNVTRSEGSGPPVASVEIEHAAAFTLAGVVGGLLPLIPVLP